MCDNVVLDGEITCHDENGAIDFDRMRARFAVKNSSKIAAAMRRNPVTFYAFDILELSGRDLRKLPLNQRQRILSEDGQDNVINSMDMLQFFSVELDMQLNGCI